MKDEGARMGLKAFKALGVGFALSEEIKRRVEFEDIINTLISNHTKQNLVPKEFKSDISEITFYLRVSKCYIIYRVTQYSIILGVTILVESTSR